MSFILGQLRRKKTGRVEIKSSSLMGSASSLITGDDGEGTPSYGAFMQAISGNLTAADNVVTVPDTDDEKFGNFFNILPVIPVLMAGADRSSNIIHSRN